MSARIVNTALTRMCVSRRLLDKSLFNVTCCVGGKQSAVCSTFSQARKCEVSDHSVGSMLYHSSIDAALSDIVFSSTQEDKCPKENRNFENLKKRLQKLESESSPEQSFEEQLKKCQSLKEVLEQLHLKSEKVTGHMAAAALLRIHDISSRQDSGEELDFFTVKTVTDKLLHTVKAEVDTIDNRTLISLLQCHVAYKSKILNGQASYFIKKAASRIRRGVFSKSELFNLYQIMSKGRLQSLDESNIVEMFIIASKEKDNYLLQEINKQIFCKCWWKLNVKEMVAIVTLLQPQEVNKETASYMVNWLSRLHSRISDQDLIHIINGLKGFRYRNKELNSFLVKYVKTCGMLINTDVLAVILMYLSSVAVYSPQIMDATAEHFVKYGDTYTNSQLALILRKFGQMNHTPANCTEFFDKVEHTLMSKFSELEPNDILKILSCFLYIGRYPKRFVHLLYSPMFLSKIEAIESESVKEWAKKKLIQIDTTFGVLKFEKPRRHFVDQWRESAMKSQSSDDYYISYPLARLMQSVFGKPNEYYISHAFVRSISVVMMFLDNEGRVLHISEKEKSARRLALLWIPENAYYMDSDKYRGIYRWRNWVVKNSGTDVLMASTPILKERMQHILNEDGISSVTHIDAFKSLLSDHIWMV